MKAGPNKKTRDRLSGIYSQAIEDAITKLATAEQAALELRRLGDERAEEACRRVAKVRIDALALAEHARLDQGVK